jgi:hypothetical protein
MAGRARPESLTPEEAPRARPESLTLEEAPRARLPGVDQVDGRRLAQPLDLQAVHHGEHLGGKLAGIIDDAFGQGGELVQGAPLTGLEVGMRRVAGRERLGLQYREEPDDLRLLGVTPDHRVAHLGQADPAVAPELMHRAAQFLGERAGVLLVAVFQDRDEQAVLGADVMQHARHGQAAAVGDVLHRQAPEAAFGDQFRGHLKDLTSSLGGG